MKHMSSVLTMLLVVCLAPAAATAQVDPDRKPPVRPTTLNIALGGFASYGGGGADLRVSTAIPISRRRSLELFIGKSESQDYFKTQGVYGAQFRRMRGRQDAGYRGYTSIGVMGLVGRYEGSSCGYSSCWRTQTHHVYPPFLMLLGGGVDIDLKPRVNLHLESQVAVALFVPVSVRAAIGVSIPLGRGASSSNRWVSR
jgi:hypothetical protein